MRQHLSVLTLLTRSTIYPIAVLLAVMAAVEAVLFSLAMGANGTLSLTGMIRSSRIVWVFGAAFLLLTVAGGLSGSTSGNSAFMALHVTLVASVLYLQLRFAKGRRGKTRERLADAHRQLRQIEVKQQAPDHPILWGVPETNYLKFFLFQVI